MLIIVQQNENEYAVFYAFLITRGFETLGTFIAHFQFFYVHSLLVQTRFDSCNHISNNEKVHSGKENFIPNIESSQIIK